MKLPSAVSTALACVCACTLAPFARAQSHGTSDAPSDARSDVSSDTTRDEQVEDNFASGGAPESRKVVAIELTPFGFFVGHYGGSVEIVPVPHHALLLSAYYARSQTNDPQFIQADPSNAVAVPMNHFHGVGGEIGYRYYFGALGPHGLYVGPSLLLGRYHVDLYTQTAVSTPRDFADVGGAIDVGYQAILAGVVLGFGVGAQYVHAGGGIPDQDALVTNSATQSAVRPRVTFTVGYAF